MLHKRFVANENTDQIQTITSDSAPIKKLRTDSASDSSPIPAPGSSSGDRAVVHMAFGNSNRHEIDEDLHSRQLAVYGRETMRRLFASNVLISGMHGLGAEIGMPFLSLIVNREIRLMLLLTLFWGLFAAKNLILAGVKSVTLHDESVVELWDLSSNFVFSEGDIGKNRADASVNKLQDLNNAVAVSSLTTGLTKEQLSGFEVGRGTRFPVSLVLSALNLLCSGLLDRELVSFIELLE